MDRDKQPAAREKTCTYGDDEHRVEARAGTGVEPEDAVGEGDLEGLAEDVDAEAGDDDCADVDSACAELDGVEEEGAYRGDDGGEPWYKTVDDAPDDGCHRDTDHAD